MLASHMGFYNTATTRTHVRFQFSTHAAAGGNVAPNSAFEAADLRIYRAADGAAFSATQRSSANGITMTSPFDSLTGFHDVDIDLTDNTDSGFYASGYQYSVVLAPDETVDGQTISAVVLAYFEIGLRTVNVTQFGGSAGTFASGRPEVNTTHLAGTSQTGRDIGASVLISSGTGSGQLSVTSGVIAANVTQAGGSAISQSGGLLNANVTQISGDSTAADNLESYTDGTTRAPVNVTQFGGSNGSFASGIPAVNATQISGDSTAADNLETAYDDTAGAVPWSLISHQGTLQSVGSTTSVTLAASASAEDDVYIGATIHFVSGTTGVKQSALISDYNGTTKVATLGAAVPVALAGTITYKIVATAPAPAAGGAPSAADIADAVWEEAIADHSGTAGSTAEQLAAAGAAGDPWATALPGSYSSGQAGKIIGDNLNATISSRASQASVDTVDGIVDAILVDTAEIGAAGAGLTEAGGTGDQLTAIPWNAAWDAEVQSEATDALNAYDPPTRAEATSDANSILTAVADVPTNAELATALAAADDAVLAAVAGVQSDTNDIQSRLPDALVSGSIKANITHVIGDAVQENGATDTNWGGSP